MKIRIIFFVLMLSALVTGQSLLSNVQKEFEKIKSFKCNFSQLITSGADSQNIISNGSFIFKKEDDYRIEYGGKVIISDGTNYWNYDNKTNRLIISVIEDDPMKFSLRRFLFDYPGSCDIVEEENSIKFIPYSDEMGLDNITIWVDENFWVKKIRLVDFSNISYIFQLSNIDRKFKANSKIFKFDPPKGCKVIDLR